MADSKTSNAKSSIYQLFLAIFLKKELAEDISVLTAFESKYNELELEIPALKEEILLLKGFPIIKLLTSQPDLSDYNEAMEDVEISKEA